MADNYYIGIDIGGTKSAALLANGQGEVLFRKEVVTMKGKPGDWRPTVDVLKDAVADFGKRRKVESIGISCGGPLDTRQGVLLSPPNLPGWDAVPIKEIFQDTLHVPTFLENDANAGALAEWRFGAGKGVRNMIFLTFGTGMGAGLILDGRLYKGTNDLGGEVGHVRLARQGPLGYHKQGSFEGFCSGTGLAQMMADELQRLARAGHSEVLRNYKAPGKVTGKDVVHWARQGDKTALKIVTKSGRYLGKALALMIDILNPELIVIGSMGCRLGELLLGPAREVIRREAIPAARMVCRIVPARLGERIGDYAALCVAMLGESLVSSNLDRA